MFRIDRDTLYSLQELPELLVGTVTLPTLLDRLGLRDRRTFKGALLGAEILDAFAKAPTFTEANQVDAQVVNMTCAGRGRSANGGPLRPLGAADLKGREV